MVGTLVVFSYDAYCMEDCISSPPETACIASGNVGIIVSEYYADPNKTAYEVLVGDRVFFDVDPETVNMLGEKNVTKREYVI